MRTLEEIRERCALVDGHWLWRGAVSVNGRPKIFAPDYTAASGAMTVQSGMRAMWHCDTGKPIPPGHKVWAKCGEDTCVCPGHLRCGTHAQWGAWLASTDLRKGKASIVIANMRIARGRAKLTPALVMEIQSSAETGLALSARLGVSTSTISRARRGEIRSVQAMGMFSGLLASQAANTQWERRA